MRQQCRVVGDFEREKPLHPHQQIQREASPGTLSVAFYSCLVQLPLYKQCTNERYSGGSRKGATPRKLGRSATSPLPFPFLIGTAAEFNHVGGVTAYGSRSLLMEEGGKSEHEVQPKRTFSREDLHPGK